MNHKCVIVNAVPQSRGEHKAKKGTKPTRMKSFGRFLESGRGPGGSATWSPSAEGEIPRLPDGINGIGLKPQTKDGRQKQEFEIKKPIRIVEWGSLHCGIDTLLG